jgi:hypothetical protein
MTKSQKDLVIKTRQQQYTEHVEKKRFLKGQPKVRRFSNPNLEAAKEAKIIPIQTMKSANQLMSE